MGWHARRIMQSSERSGFSLIEIILAVIVLAASTVAILRYTQVPDDRVKQSAYQLQLEQLEIHAKQFRADYRRWPSSNMQELRAHRYLAAEIPVCPVDQQPLVLDTKTGRVIPHNH